MRQIHGVLLPSLVWVLAVIPAEGIAQVPSRGPVDSQRRESVLAGSHESDTRLVTLPRRAVLLRTVHGGYEQHAQVFTEFMAYAEATYRTVGYCFGIYPMDPDAAKRGNLTWQVGVEVAVGPPGHIAALATAQSPDRIVQTLKRPKEGYAFSILPATQAAALASTVDGASEDGLSLVRWMAEHGYVQTAPTRMEYLSHDGPAPNIPTRIVVPVAKRARGLQLAPRPDR